MREREAWRRAWLGAMATLLAAALGAWLTVWAPRSCEKEPPAVRRAAPAYLPTEAVEYWSWQPDETPESPVWRQAEGPVEVSEYFAPAAWVGDREDVSFDEHWRAEYRSAPDCARCVYAPGDSQELGWAGIGWVDVMYPQYSVGVDLSKIDRLSFWIKGDEGGEQVEFRVGGTEDDNAQPSCSTGVISLSRAWQEVSIPLDITSELHLDRVFSGFMWLASERDNPSGCSFLIDDVRLE
ncbi:MAG: carbohydrate binding domain-containing protein [Actinomycetota bacterium]|nr:carbohydrate binding domain-containing protein [Actinomycetota bacterium]